MLMQRVDGAAVEVARRARLTDDQIRRARAMQMYRMRLEGQTTAQVAKFFSFSRQHVNRSIRGIPAWQKARIERFQASLVK